MSNLTELIHAIHRYKWYNKSYLIQLGITPILYASPFHRLQQLAFGHSPSDPLRDPGLQVFNIHNTYDILSLQTTVVTFGIKIRIKKYYSLINSSLYHWLLFLLIILIFFIICHSPFGAVFMILLSWVHIYFNTNPLLRFLFWQTFFEPITKFTTHVIW